MPSTGNKDLGPACLDEGADQEACVFLKTLQDGFN